MPDCFRNWGRGGFRGRFPPCETAAGEVVKPYSFNVQPTVSQTVYAGSGMRNAYRRAQTQYEISQCSSSDIRLQTVYAAEYGYWNLAADIALLDAAREYLNIVESLLGVVDSRFEDGYISKSDVLMVQARRNEAQYSLRTQERIYLTSLHNFNVQMGVDPSAEAVLADSILTWMKLPVRRSVERFSVQDPIIWHLGCKCAAQGMMSGLQEPISTRGFRLGLREYGTLFHRTLPARRAWTDWRSCA